MRLLVLGGTVFLGRAVARHARDAGHEVTCVARGESGDPVEGVRFVVGDRDAPGGLSAVAGETFDAVVDVTRIPRHARHAVHALAGRVGHWSYVSSISVYADLGTPNLTPDATPLLPPADGDGGDGGDPEQYGRCKVSCEQILREAVGDDSVLICRAGLIVGPEDPSGRFTYWVDRLARGGRVLAPGSPDDLVQVVDVRDLAAWLVHTAEHQVTGVFDGTGPVWSREQCLRHIAAGVAAEPTIVWADADFLREHDVNYWSGPRSLPLWVPMPELSGMLARDVSAAAAAGLTVRPLADTAAATLDWHRHAPDSPVRAGLTVEQEAELLRRWDVRAG